ncbi:hypothetical protein niasHT_037292 [Heterodera trifolii]|uniref:Uncharacterized protein n=1 Tax=Heterodera trifolii TaxID=157864 RepID=A0ABD2J1W3_9BILA
MPALTTPMNGTANGQQRHFWLPNELIHELLLWVRPSYFWRVRQMLTTSAILCPLLMGGKHAITWHEPYDVWHLESTFADRKFGPTKVCAYLCRNHSMLLPRNFFQFSHCTQDYVTLYVLIVLDSSKFSSLSHVALARRGFESRGSFRSTGFVIESATFVYCQDEPFDLIKLKFPKTEDVGVIMYTLQTLLKQFANYIDVVLPNHMRGTHQLEGI